MGWFMGKTNNSTIIPPLQLSDNNYSFTNKEKAEYLNDFFILFLLLMIVPTTCRILK